MITQGFRETRFSFGLTSAFHLEVLMRINIEGDSLVVNKIVEMADGPCRHSAGGTTRAGLR